MNIEQLNAARRDRINYELTLEQAERDARESPLVENDTGLHQGDHYTSSVLDFMAMAHNERQHSGYPAWY